MSETLGRYISRKRRTTRGAPSQEECARALNMGGGWWSKVERDSQRVPPSPDQLKEIARVIGGDLRYMLGLAGYAPPIEDPDIALKEELRALLAERGVIPDEEDLIALSTSMLRNLIEVLRRANETGEGSAGEEPQHREANPRPARRDARA